MATITTTDGQTVIIGPRLVNGRSAYQVWLDAGNTGTEQDYIDAISDPAATAIAPSVQAAADSAAAAAVSEENAGDSETNSAASEAKAAEWAEKAEDSEVQSGQFSAKHHALKGAASAAAASVSEGNAAGSAVTATTKAAEALASEGVATTKAAEALASATTATGAQTATEAARDLTLTYRNTAGVHAATAATEAANAAANSSGQNMAGLAGTITANAVALAPYYNTSEDDDGDWIFKNDEAHPRAVFPIVTATSLLLHDATDVDAPLYRSFDFTGFTITDVKAGNGAYIVTTTAGIVVLDFITGELDVAVKYSTSTTPALPSNAVNSVAFYLDLAAPYERLGNRMPTIGVGSDGGATLIHYDGVAADITHSDGNVVSFVKFREDGAFVYAVDSDDKARFVHVFHTPPRADVTQSFIGSRGSSDEIYSMIDYAGASSIDLRGALANQAPTTSLSSIGTSKVIFGHEEQLTILNTNPAEPSKGSKQVVTANYATPLLVGNVQGAWLSSTTAETVSGAEAVPDGDFDNAADFTITGNSTISGGQLNVAAPGGVDEHVTNTGGDLLDHTKNWRFRISITASTANQGVQLHAMRANGSFIAVLDPTYHTSVDVHTVDVLANSVGEDFVLGLYRFANHTGTVTVDNLSGKEITEGQLDRTHNENHLDIVGSLTASAANTGTEKVVFSGWSTTDYGVTDFTAIPASGDWSMEVLVRAGNHNNTRNLLEISDYNGSSYTGSVIRLRMLSGGQFQMIFSDDGFATTDNLQGATTHEDSQYVRVEFGVQNGAFFLRTNDDEAVTMTPSAASGSLANANARLYIGKSADNSFAATPSIEMADVIPTLTVPSTDQQKHATAISLASVEAGNSVTIAGSSSAVIDHDYDEKTDKLYVLTSAGESVFNQSTGVRLLFDATKAGNTLVSVKEEYIARADATEVDVSGPAINLRVEAQRCETPPRTFVHEALGDAVTVDFQMPLGARVNEDEELNVVMVDRDVFLPSEDFSVKWNGYRDVVTFTPAATPPDQSKVRFRLKEDR